MSYTFYDGIKQTLHRTFAINPGQHVVAWIMFKEAAGARNFSVLLVELVSMFK